MGYQWASKFYKLCAAAEAEVTSKSFELAIIPKSPKYIANRFTDTCRRMNPSHPSEIISIFASVVAEQEDQAAAIESLNNRKRKNDKPSLPSGRSALHSLSRHLQETKGVDKDAPIRDSANSFKTSTDRKSGEI
jgi:hypothetical protein